MDLQKVSVSCINSARNVETYLEIEGIHSVRESKHDIRDSMWKNLVGVCSPCGAVVPEYIAVEFSLNIRNSDPTKYKTRQNYQISKQCGRDVVHTYPLYSLDCITHP